MAYKRKYITSYFRSKRRRTTGGRKRATGKSRIIRRRRTTFKRRGYKTKRAARYRKAAQHKTVRYTVHGEEYRLSRDTSAHDFVKICVQADFKNAYDHMNTNSIRAYQVLYDEFRIVSQTVHFWLASTNMVTDKTHDSIIEMYNVYDPDALGRKFANAPQDYSKVAGYKRRQMKPYVHYKVKLFPTWTDVINGQGGGLPNLKNHTKSGKWFDMSYISTAGMGSYNAQQVCFVNLDSTAGDPDDTWTDIKGQTYITYEFRGKRNDQAYE